MDPLAIFLMLVAGSLVGLVSSFFGVGACFIMVPVMIYCFERFLNTPSYLAPLIAFGTNMAIVVPTAVSGVLRHKKELKARRISFPMKHYLSFAVPVGFGSFTGSLFAFLLFSSFRKEAGILLKTIFGLFCLFGAYRFMKAKPLKISELKPPSLIKHSLFGFASGILAHFIGIGGGIIYMPVLNTFLRIPVHLAVPVSLATMIIGSSIGAASFGFLGRLDQVLHPSDYPPLSWGWLNLVAFVCIGIPSVLMAQIGPKLAHKVSPKRFKILLAVVYIYIGFRLIIRGICQIQGIPPLIP